MAAGWRNIAFRGQDTCYAVPFHQSAMADWSWQNMPSAAAFLFGSHRHVTKLDLTMYTQARVVVNIQGTAGSAGSKLILRYYTSFSTTASSYLDIGTSEISVTITSTDSVTASSWINLAAGAKTDVWVAIIGSGGDGATDPKIGNVVGQFR